MTDLPEPLTPADSDLRSFPFMPMDIVRLFGSEFHAEATDAEWRAGVTLWLKSFHQVPAASLPNNDVALCRLAEFGTDMKRWRKVREGALRGWIRCADGRLYHPVVAEKATAALEKKLAHEKNRKADRERLKSWREKKRAQPAKNGVNAGGETEVKRVSSACRNASETSKRGRGRGRVIGTEREDARAQRLPSDWTLPRPWAEFSIAEGLSEAETNREALKFRDYWIAKAGKDGRKADWEATWRNWIRRDVEGRKKAPPVQSPHAAMLAKFGRKAPAAAPSKAQDDPPGEREGLSIFDPAPDIAR